MTMEEKLTREQDLSSLVERVNRGGLKIKTPKPKGTWGGARKGAGAKKGEKRRKTLYDELSVPVNLSTSPKLLSRLEAEAARLNVSKSYVFSEWLSTLPESTEEKTQAMHDAYMIKKAMKEL